MEFVRETVRKWERQGVVKFMKQKPQIVSPLSVVERQQASGISKKRLCWDGSRCINKLLKKQRVTLAHLQKALEITEQGDLQTKYDLQSAYFHVRIYEKHWTFLGAKFADEKGNSQYFIFCHLPFGLATAVHAMTKLFKPINAFCGAKGIRHTIFIDDGRLLAKTKEQSREEFAIVKQTLRNAGWQLEKRKTEKDDEGNTQKQYLGFEIGSQIMQVKMTKYKAELLVKSLEEIIGSRNRFVPLKFLAAVAGRAIASEAALGPIVHIQLRRTYQEIEAIVERRGWSSNIRITDEVAFDLEHLKSEVQKMKGFPIRTEATAISVVSIIGPHRNT